jgi:hypothetical protein
MVANMELDIQISFIERERGVHVRSTETTNGINIDP